MILSMEKLSAFGLLRDREEILRALMRERCVQVRSLQGEDYDALREVTESCPVDVYGLEQRQGRYAAAIAAMAPFVAKAGLFAQKPRLAFGSLESEGKLAEAEQLCGRIEGHTAKINELRSGRNKDQFLQTSLEPWLQDTLPLELEQTKATQLLRVLLPARTERGALEKRTTEAAPSSYLEVVGSDNEQLYMTCVCHKEQTDDLWQALGEFGATRVSFSGLRGTAAQNHKQLAERMREADEAVGREEAALRELGRDIFPLRYGYDALGAQIQRARAAAEMRATRDAFCFTAWVPEEVRDRVVKVLEDYGCCYEFEPCGAEEEAPILMHNNRMATPYEAVTEMYSLPAYHGFDPNNFVAVFYFIFFGMMLSDAGFGLVLFFGGMLLGKKMDLGPSAQKLVKVISMGGLSAVIWGAIYGSWFGDLIPVIADVFFHVEITIPYLLDPLEQAVVVMGMCMAMGLVHILFGMGIKAYMLVKRGHVLDAVFDVGFWFLVLLGLTAMLSTVILPVPQLLFTVGTWMSIAGAVGLIFTQGRDKKNPILRVGSGIMSLYDITGYFSDVLSYSRILALGLATGVIAQVVNIMGTLAGGGFIGILVFIPVFLVGSALNLGINTLGAYVHTARLQYVEFFGKFYEAGGRPFRPLSPNTKYTVITSKEEL